MSDDLRIQIFRNLDLKETDELLDIWKTNDRVEWSDLAFDIMKEVLNKRMGDLPPQNEPILEYQEEKEKDLEDWEIKLLDNESQPDFYDTLDVISLTNKINKLAIAYVIVSIVSVLVYFRSFQGVFQGILPSFMGGAPSILLSLLVSIFSVGVNVAIVYFALKALAYILRILMEMEFTSREVKQIIKQ